MLLKSTNIFLSFPTGYFHSGEIKIFIRSAISHQFVSFEIVQH